MARTIIAAAFVAAALGAHAAPAKLEPALAPIGFLVGDWTSGQGEVGGTRQPSAGSSRIEPAAGGGALLRRDHTEVFDKTGAKVEDFDQVMLIYPEAGVIRADYTDGDHVLHYRATAVDPGRAVTFDSAADTGRPRFRLVYRLQSDGGLAVEFATAPAGAAEFHPIATGVLRKSP